MPLLFFYIINLLLSIDAIVNPFIFLFCAEANFTTNNFQPKLLFRETINITKVPTFFVQNIY